MSWVKRQLASTLFATPPTATMEEALDCFRRAEEASRRTQKPFKVNAENLAAALHTMGKNEEAVQYLRQAIALPSKTEDDNEAHARAVALLAKLGG